MIEIVSMQLSSWTFDGQPQSPLLTKITKLKKITIIYLKVHPITCHEGPEGE